MMRKILLFFLFLPISLLHANEKGGVVVEQKDGKCVTYAFSQKPVITYRGEILVMTTNTVVVEYPLSDLACLSFTDADIDAVDAPLMVTPTTDDDGYRIYTLDGKLMRNVSAGIPLSTRGLPEGIYIIRNNNKSFKIILK